MQAFYDKEPQKLEAMGDGSYKYRYNIREEEVSNASQSEEGVAPQSDEEKRTQWACEEVTVFAPLSSNKITQAALTERWEGNYEQKLVNEYNAAQMGLYTDEEAAVRIAAYMGFLKERAALKTQVDADCEELGVR